MLVLDLNKKRGVLSLSFVISLFLGFQACKNESISPEQVITPKAKSNSNIAKVDSLGNVASNLITDTFTAAFCKSCSNNANIGNPECLQAVYLKLQDQKLNKFQENYKIKHGINLDDKALLDDYLGFYIDTSGVFISAIHAYQSYIQALGINNEYLAGRDGPSLKSSGIEFFFIGSSAKVIESGGCYDCVPVNQLGDIVVAKIIDPQYKPTNKEIITIADSIPKKGKQVYVVGKPFIVGDNQRRVNIGIFKQEYGNGAIVSNFVVGGFSGGPMLNENGEAFAETVTRVDMLNTPHPASWDSSWGIGVSLIKYKAKINRALTYARTHKK